MDLAGVIIVRVNNAFGTTAVAVSGGFLKAFKDTPKNLDGTTKHIWNESKLRFEGDIILWTIPLC